MVQIVAVVRGAFLARPPKRAVF